MIPWLLLDKSNVYIGTSFCKYFCRTEKNTLQKNTAMQEPRIAVTYTAYFEKSMIAAGAKPHFFLIKLVLSITVATLILFKDQAQGYKEDEMVIISVLPELAIN